jgi:hypothetical protein
VAAIWITLPNRLGDFNNAAEPQKRSAISEVVGDTTRRRNKNLHAISALFRKPQNSCRKYIHHDTDDAV